MLVGRGRGTGSDLEPGAVAGECEVGTRVILITDITIKVIYHVMGDATVPPGPDPPVLTTARFTAWRAMEKEAHNYEHGID